MDALKFATSEFNRFEDDCFIEPLNGTGLLFIYSDNSIKIYMVDKPICITGGVVFLFVASHGDLKFSLAAKVGQDNRNRDSGELPPLEKGVTVEAVHQITI